MAAESDPATATATRTLITAGFTITRSRRQPTHIEIYCERADMFGVAVPYLIAVCEGNEPPANDVPNIKKEAATSGRIVVLIAKQPGSGWLSWQDFLDSLGGAVPSWRALSPDFEAILLTAAKNEVPPALSGEAWQIFEDAVADGFEFAFGHRVNRLGGRRRGRRVSDMVTQTPNDEVLVLDAKASKHPFDATWDELRPLVEYTKSQVIRQRGQREVRGAVLIAGDYKQDDVTLGRFAGDFVADVKVPLSFLRAKDLAGLVKTLGADPGLRSSINWASIFCRGGFIPRDLMEAEIEAARISRYPKGEPLGRR